MLRSFFLAVGLVAATASADDRPKYVPGRYIIQLKPGSDTGSINAHHEAVRRLARRAVEGVDAAPKPVNVFEKRDDRCPGGVVVTVTQTATVTQNAAAAPTPAGAAYTPGADINECVKRTFTLGHGNFNAYVGNFDASTVEEIKKMPDVLNVEQDEYIYLPSSWPIKGSNPYPVAQCSESAAKGQPSPSGSGYKPGNGHASPSGSGYKPVNGNGYASPSGSGYHPGSGSGTGSIKTPGSGHYPTGSPVSPGAAHPTGAYPIGNSTTPSAVANSVSSSILPSGTGIPIFNGSTPSLNASLTTQSNSIWSLADLSHKNGIANATSYSYIYDSSAGAGTTAYVFDTGIRSTHEEFGGRVRFGINALTNSTTSAANGNNDNAGHGTHVAGTLAGKTYGVAKKAQLVDVKVFDTGSATMSSILAGLDWAFKDVQLQGNLETAVFSMSFGARTSSTALDASIKALHDFGILTVVAAGNDNAEIGNTSPARLPEAFTVGYTNQQRQRVDSSSGVQGSNYGPELDIWAPGYQVESASYLSDTGVMTESGTSMATPVVSGLICYLRSVEGGLGTPQLVTQRVLGIADKGVVKDARDSANVLVYNGNGA